MTKNIQEYMQNMGVEARKASRLMASADTNVKNLALTHIAKAILREEKALLAANKLDLDAARANGLDNAMLDRLTITEKSINTMVEGLNQIASLADPIGEMTDFKYRPSGIHWQNACTTRCDWHYLRGAAKRYCGCGWPLH